MNISIYDLESPFIDLSSVNLSNNFTFHYRNNTTNNATTRVFENVLAGSILLVIGLIGFSAHVSVFLLTIFSEESRKYEVSRIIAMNAFFEGILCLTTGPWVATGIALQEYLFTKEIAFLTIIPFVAALNLDMLLAINRWIASTRPLDYEDWFSPKRMTFYLGNVMVVSSMSCIPFGIPSCRWYLDYHFYAITYEDTQCGRTLAYIEQALGMITVVAASLNIITFVRMRRHTKKVAGKLGDKKAQHRAKRELRFIIQALVTSTSTFITTVGVNFLKYMANDKWTMYGVTSLISTTSFATDGILLLLMNNSVGAWISSHCPCCSALQKEMFANPASKSMVPSTQEPFANIKSRRPSTFSTNGVAAGAGISSQSGTNNTARMQPRSGSFSMPITTTHH